MRAAMLPRAARGIIHVSTRVRPPAIVYHQLSQTYNATCHLAQDLHIINIFIHPSIHIYRYKYGRPCRYNNYMGAHVSRVHSVRCDGDRSRAEDQATFT